MGLRSDLRYTIFTENLRSKGEQGLKMSPQFFQRTMGSALNVEDYPNIIDKAEEGHFGRWRCDGMHEKMQSPLHRRAVRNILKG